ncbi:MAG TPA: molybdate ABC transporter substrate-binding protein [Steroidobacter sp.]
MKTTCGLLALIAALASSLSLAAESAKEPLVVFGAASLTDTLQKISDAYTASSGVPVKLSFAASSALARQIESGARADLFFSADQEWMDYLQDRRLIQTATRIDLLGNRLVLIAPRHSKVSIDLKPNAPLLAALGSSGRMAIAEPELVPAGRYGKAALIWLGVWPGLESRLARAENVRVALMYVARGETPLGIVYATDAKVDPDVRVVAEFPQSSHPPVTYPVALTAVARPAAAEYLRYLRSDAAREIFGQAGFTVLGEQGRAAVPDSL